MFTSRLNKELQVKKKKTNNLIEKDTQAFQRRGNVLIIPHPPKQMKTCSTALVIKEISI